MYRWIASIVLVYVLTLGNAAWAAEQIDLNCLNMPACCQITCVRIDLVCCGCFSSQDPLVAEFIDVNGQVLGTATFEGCWCNGESTSPTDVPINSSDVCSIRLIKPTAADDIVVTWASVRVYCEDTCYGKWYMVFKNDLWCWEQISAPAPEVAQPPIAVPPPVKQEPVVTAQPEPKPDFGYFPEPKPEPEPEPEVISVIGRG